MVDGEVVRDEFPDWKATIKGSRVEQSSISKGDYKPGYPERGLGRGRGRGRGRGQGRSLHDDPRDRVSSQRPGPSEAGIGHDSANEVTMTSNKSDDDHGLFRSPVRSPWADQSTRSSRGDSGSVSPTEALDGYSEDMVRLKSTSDGIAHSSQQDTFRATPR